MGHFAGVDCNFVTSPYVDSRVDSNTCSMSNPMPESTLLNPVPESTLSSSRGLRIRPLYCAFSESDVRVSYLNKALCDDAH